MDGRPTEFIHYAEGGYEVIRIGDPKSTVRDPHLCHRLHPAGALNHFADHEERYWDLIGPEWQVRIDDGTATVTGPAAIGRWDCFAGPAGGRDCAQPTVAGGTARFHQTGLGNGAALTAVSARPSRWPGGCGATGGSSETLPGLVPDKGARAVEERKPLVGAPPVSVEFVPPDDIRPAQVGALTKERAQVVEVTATIVDFAVRRKLRIRELRRPDAERPHDRALEKLTGVDRGFLPYHRTLFRSLFADRDEDRRWYRYRPDRVRSLVRARTFLLFLGALAVTAGLGFIVHLGLLGVGPVAAAVTLFLPVRPVPRPYRQRQCDAGTGAGPATLHRDHRGGADPVPGTGACRGVRTDRTVGAHLRLARRRRPGGDAVLVRRHDLRTSRTRSATSSMAVGSVGATPVSAAGGSGLGSGRLLRRRLLGR
jgi:hypothetical protein